MSLDAVLKSLSIRDPDVFVEAWLAAGIQKQSEREEVLRLAIPYALAFDNYRVALLAVGLLGERVDGIPESYYQLGAEDVRDIIYRYPELVKQMQDGLKLFPASVLSTDFIEDYCNLRKRRQRELFRWAIDSGQAATNSIVRYARRMFPAGDNESVSTTNIVSAEEQLRVALLQIIASTTVQDFINMLASLKGDDSIRLSLIDAVLGNQTILDLIADADALHVYLIELLEDSVESPDDSLTAKRLARLARFVYLQLQAQCICLLLHTQ